jgi:hypothetical protein
LRLLARRAAYQSLRAARGKLDWSLEGDWTAPAENTAPTVQESPAPYGSRAARKGKR